MLGLAGVEQALAVQFHQADPRVLDTLGRALRSLDQVLAPERRELVTGGPGPVEGLAGGAYVKPTIFADVDPESVIAREEIFGPVLAIISYASEDDAVEIANSTIYGLSGAVYGETEHALDVAKRVRSGQVYINDGQMNLLAPFGGYKQSGNGREMGRFGLEEFLEVKAIQR